MDIDMAILRSLEREKEISLDVLIDAIESALLVAYQRTPGAEEDARVNLDRKSGHVRVLVQERDESGDVVRSSLNSGAPAGVAQSVRAAES